jgi:hypothetical protein
LQAGITRHLINRYLSGVSPCEEEDNVVVSIMNWLIDYSDVITLAIVLLLLCGMVVGIEHIWSRWLHDPVLQLWYKFVKNPASWLLQPFQRAHARWSNKYQREMMAKWRKGHYANAFYNTIHQMIDDGICSPQQGKQLQAKMAQFFGLDDLARIKTHEDAIRHRLELNKIHEIGPVQDKPAWGDKPAAIKKGDFVGPPIESLGSKFLKKRGTV